MFESADVDIGRLVDSVWIGDRISLPLRLRKKFSAGSSFWNSAASDRPDGASCALQKASAALQRSTRAEADRNVIGGFTVMPMDIYAPGKCSVRRRG